MRSSSVMSREELEQQALENVCACWFYEFRNDIGLATEDDLKAVIKDGMTCHYEAQKHDPVPEDEYQEELRECPSYIEA